MYVQLLQNIYIYIRFTLNINVWLYDFFYLDKKKSIIPLYSLLYKRYYCTYVKNHRRWVMLHPIIN